MSLFDTSMWCYHSIKVQVKLMIYWITTYIKIIMWLIPYDLLEYKTPLSFSFCHVCIIFRIKEENSITNEVEYNTSTNILLSTGCPVTLKGWVRISR